MKSEKKFINYLGSQWTLRRQRHLQVKQPTSGLVKNPWQRQCCWERTVEEIDTVNNMEHSHHRSGLITKKDQELNLCGDFFFLIIIIWIKYTFNSLEWSQIHNVHAHTEQADVRLVVCWRSALAILDVPNFWPSRRTSYWPVSTSHNALGAEMQGVCWEISVVNLLIKSETIETW